GLEPTTAAWPCDATDARFGSQGDDGEAGRRRESPRQWDCSPRGHGTGGTPSVVTAAREGGADDPCELERFGDVREGPQRSGLLRESGVGPSRHDDDRERGTQSEDSLEDRSEEHTSELQSPDHLVCRLLLEKKK